MKKMPYSHNSKILKLWDGLILDGTTQGWSTTRQISHMDTVGLLRQTMNITEMDNLNKVKRMDISDRSIKMAI